MSKRTHLTGALAVFLAFTGTAGASTLVPQTALPGQCIPQFELPMPVFGPAGPIPRVDAGKHPALTVTMKEIDQAVLPQHSFFCPDINTTVTPGKTRVWAYETKDTLTKKPLAPAVWPAVTVEAKRFIPTVVTYDNQLPQFGDKITINGQQTTALVQGLVTVDQSTDWTDPLGVAAANNCTMFPMLNPLAPACNVPFEGPPPAVPHLHGAEITSKFDGGPLAWFTPNGLTGRDYETLYNAGPGKAVYLYNNLQEPGTLWFHDHAMGQTRTNVYSGMAAFYFLRDADREPRNLPAGPFEIEMALQDRQFDTNGQLYFPDGSDPLCGTGQPNDPCLNGAPPNPDVHPFWIPEFIGDVNIVNGAPWPVLNVEPRRYRFRLLGGTNARMYNLDFGPAKVYVIGSDDNYLNAPKKISKVFIAPGERYDVIVDFTGLANQTITVTNDAPVPYPSGLSPVPVPGFDALGNPIMLPADQPQMANVMQIKVSKPLSSRDKSCNPAFFGQCVRPTPVVRLSDGNGNMVKGLKIDKKRQLILKEFEGPGGPEIVLVNNSQFMGQMSPGIDPSVFPDGVTETPQVGSTELWEIINLTMDAHPMHTHLTQFQVLNRQQFAGDLNTLTGGYYDAWAASFPAATAYDPICTGGVFCPGYGPPRPYQTPNADGALGGNPAIGPYLVGTPTAPAYEESGWKDTAKAYPGQVLRMLVRWTPSSVPVFKNFSFAGHNLYTFDPANGPGYVWHCHIIDHEDQDMMRPYKVTH